LCTFSLPDAFSNAIGSVLDLLLVFLIQFELVSVHGCLQLFLILLVSLVFLPNELFLLFLAASPLLEALFVKTVSQPSPTQVTAGVEILHLLLFGVHAPQEGTESALAAFETGCQGDVKGVVRAKLFQGKQGFVGLDQFKKGGRYF